MDKKSFEKLKNLPANIKVGFDSETIDLPIDQIAAVKIVQPATLKTAKFMQVLASIREVGVIEAPIVCRDRKSQGKYILLDGHLRIAALKELGETEVTCLVSTDDEAFTYNKHVNRLSPVQEHKMVLKAIERGVPEDRLASALNVDVSSIARKRNLLDGICKETADILKDKMVSASVFPILRRMQPLRQIEAATLMTDANTFSESFAQALFAATPRNLLLDPSKPKKVKGLSDEEMARMEGEMESLQREYMIIEENYGEDMVNLTLMQGYLRALLGNAKIVRYLAQCRADFLAEFQKIADITSLKEQEAT
jgi:RepB plasmid partitioning protein/ParB-like nuclease domain